ncbi:acid protease [Coprinopsis marcescibilis]|uniref:Acid protease n=1 Tax=Coprinopsis marcescibilis TaxID=230819 RepID=A0A5C3KL85_COPMA|nr:acid protease [Coprinopsis marcescibilis]
MAAYTTIWIWISALYLGSVLTYARTIEFARRTSSGLVKRQEGTRNSRGGVIIEPYTFVHRLDPANSTNVTSPVGNVEDVRYTTNITLNGKNFVVALDTGSTDLWVHPVLEDLGDVNGTGIPLDLRYGDGSYGVRGNISFAPLEIGEHSVPSQAFLAVQTGNIRGIRDIGLDGLLGFGFDASYASPINLAIKQVQGQNSTSGQSVLRNIFSQDPILPNFVAFDLARTDDLEEIIGGSLSIGEYDQRWKEVQDAPKIPQYPKRAVRWTALLEGVTVDGVDLTLESTLPGVPGGSLLALLDTGDPTAVLPLKIRDDIYSRIPGAVRLTTEDGYELWILPCNTTTSVAFTFGGQSFAMHPLDLSAFSRPINLGGSEYTACIGTIAGGGEYWAGNDLEVSLGDVFLRNVYSVFHFGDEGGEPYIQLLSQTDPEKAASDVVAVRNRTMASLAPEIAPAQLLDLILANSTLARGPRPTGPDGVAALAIAQMDPRGYGLLLVALLAGSMLIGVVLIGLAVLIFIRDKNEGRVARRRSSHRPLSLVLKSGQSAGPA